MAALAPAVPYLIGGGTALSAISSVNQASANSAALKYQARVAENNAIQLEQQANEEEVTAQRKAIEYKRISRLQQSRALALAAASGGSAHDPTVVDNLADIGEVGEYNALTALYEGSTAASTYRYQAELTRSDANVYKQQAKHTKKQGNLTALATVLGGGAAIGKLYA